MNSPIFELECRIHESKTDYFGDADDYQQRMSDEKARSEGNRDIIEDKVQQLEKYPLLNSVKSLGVIADLLDPI